MKKIWNPKMRFCALMLAGFMFAAAGCTSKNSISSVQEEETITEQIPVDPENEGLYNQWIHKEDANDQELEPAETEYTADLSESDAKNRALAEAMQRSGEDASEVDQTSVKIQNQNENAYLVSVNYYGGEREDSSDGTWEVSGSGGTEWYRVDKRTGEVSYLTSENEF